MGFLTRFRKRWAIRSYARRLPRLLAADYGRSKRYTPPQVKATIERSGLNSDYFGYAVAMFSDRDGFEHFHAELGENRSFDEARAELLSFCYPGEDHFWDGADAFSSNSDFSPHDHGSGDFSGGGHY
ncbi:MAG TPA: DUF6559 family protein [Methylocystis sp.]|nr:DUF6559 family protein [Methylocystis sp.]